MRCLCVAISLMLLAGPAPSQDPANALTAPERAEGWVLLFNGEDVSEWHIEGEHQVVAGTLILGGTKQTRATLRRRFQRGNELRFQYRTEGAKSAGVGWDFRDKRLVGLTHPTLPPEEKWRESYVEEYFDLMHPTQRFMKIPGGAVGTFATVESIWIEVEPGNKLFLRQLRLRPGSPARWPWFLAIPVVLVGLVLLLWWRWRAKRSRPS